MLDGYDIMVGDTVHDLLLGPGKVVDVSPDGGIGVRFSGKNVRYMADGTFSGFKRLYAGTPLIIGPKKNMPGFIESVRVIVESLRRNWGQ